MPAITDPRFGIQYGWDLGESGWKTGMDANLLKLGSVGVHLSVKDRNLTTPPVSPANGDTYIPAATATGVWTGHENKIAVYEVSAWVIYTPRTGWVAYIEDEQVLSRFATTWSAGVALVAAQPSDAELTAIAGLTSAADKGIQFTGAGTAATYDLTAAGKALLDDADNTAQRTTLGLAIGTNVQAYDAGLASISGLTTAANKMIYTTALDTYAVADLTAAGLALLDDADAAAQLTTLGASARTLDNLTPTATGTPAANGDMVIEATNNTTITFKLKGSDGTVRSGTITLA